MLCTNGFLATQCTKVTQEQFEMGDAKTSIVMY